MEEVKKQKDFVFFGNEDEYKDMYIVPVNNSPSPEDVDEANWKVALERLGKDNVEIASFSHWLVGWYEIMLVDKNNIEAYEEALEIEQEIEAYPVLDDEVYNEIIDERICDLWQNSEPKEKLSAYREYGHCHDNFGELYSNIRNKNNDPCIEDYFDFYYNHFC